MGESVNKGKYNNEPDEHTGIFPNGAATVTESAVYLNLRAEAVCEHRYLDLWKVSWAGNKYCQT